MDGGSSTPGGRRDRSPEDVDPGVADLLQNLHLTAEEEELAGFNDDEGDESSVTEYALVGKVISPMALHVNTIGSDETGLGQSTRAVFQVDRREGAEPL